MAKRRVETEIDSDTGEEIIYFVRRGRPVLYLRDRVTKRFIRRLRYVRLSVTMSVDYTVKGKPYRSIYIDARISTDLRPRDFPNRHIIEKELESKLMEIVEFKFNPELAGMMDIVFLSLSKEISLKGFSGSAIVNLQPIILLSISF